MKPPNLNLRRQKCSMFEVTTHLKLERSIHLELVDRRLISVEDDTPGAVYLKSYSMQKSPHGCVFHGLVDIPKKKHETVDYELHLEYRTGTPHSAWSDLNTRQLNQLFRSLQKSATEVESNVRAYFQFPLETHQPRLQLPMTLQGDKEGKTVIMTGCELQVQSGNQRYTQFLGVGKTYVRCGITSLRLDDPFTAESVRAKFQECIGITRELVNPIKGRGKR